MSSSLPKTQHRMQHAAAQIIDFVSYLRACVRHMGIMYVSFSPAGLVPYIELKNTQDVDAQQSSRPPPAARSLNQNNCCAPGRQGSGTTMLHDLANRRQEEQGGRGSNGGVRSAATPAGGDRTDLGMYALLPWVSRGSLAARLPLVSSCSTVVQLYRRQV